MANQMSDDHGDIVYPNALAFVLVHLVCFAAIGTGVTWTAIVIGVAFYWIRMFFIGAGYHRYFSHRAYKTSRWFQFVLAFMCQTTTQKSVIWWAAKHRHTTGSPTPRMTCIRRCAVLSYSHMGWIFDRKHDNNSFDGTA